MILKQLSSIVDEWIVEASFHGPPWAFFMVEGRGRRKTSDGKKVVESSIENIPNQTKDRWKKLCKDRLLVWRNYEVLLPLPEENKKLSCFRFSLVWKVFL